MNIFPFRDNHFLALESAANGDSKCSKESLNVIRLALEWDKEKEFGNSPTSTSMPNISLASCLATGDTSIPKTFAPAARASVKKYPTLQPISMTFVPFNNIFDFVRNLITKSAFHQSYNDASASRGFAVILELYLCE